MKEHITLKQFKETVKNYIEDQNASLVSCGIKINHKYKQIKILTQDDIPKPFYQRVFEYILHFFSYSQSNSNEIDIILSVGGLISGVLDFVFDKSINNSIWVI